MRVTSPPWTSHSPLALAVRKPLCPVQGTQNVSCDRRIQHRHAWSRRRVFQCVTRSRQLVAFCTCTGANAMRLTMTPRSEEPSSAAVKRLPIADCMRVWCMLGHQSDSFLCATQGLKVRTRTLQTLPTTRVTGLGMHAHVSQPLCGMRIMWANMCSCTAAAAAISMH